MSKEVSKTRHALEHSAEALEKCLLKAARESLGARNPLKRVSTGWRRNSLARQFGETLAAIEISSQVDWVKHDEKGMGHFYSLKNGDCIGFFTPPDYPTHEVFVNGQTLSGQPADEIADRFSLFRRANDRTFAYEQDSKVARIKSGTKRK